MNSSSRLNVRPPAMRPGFGLGELLPHWKALFSPRHLKGDVLAGLRVAAVAIPLSLALGLASGVSPEVGLLSAMIAGVVCALFGGTSLLISGPAAALAVLIASSVGQYGLGGLIIIGLGVGLLQVITGMLGLGRVIRAVPMPVVSGFTAGIGTVLFIWQLPRALGVSPPDENHVFDVLVHLGQLLDQARPVTVFLTLVTMGLTLGLPKVMPRMPAPLIAVAFSTLTAWALSLSVQTLGMLPHALPQVSLPSLPASGWGSLLSTAFVIFALSSLASMMSGRVVASMGAGQRHDADQDLVGLGLGNIAVSLLGGIPVTGALARSVLNVQAGAHTRRASIIQALAILVAVLLFTPLLGHVPIAALTGVLLALAVRMLHPQDLITLWKASHLEAGVFLVTYLAVVLVDFAAGVQAGILAALAIAVVRLGRSQTGLLQLETPGPYRFLLSGPLTFLSSAKLETLRTEAEALDPSRSVVFDLSDVPSVDASGAELLTDVMRPLVANRPVVIQGAREEVQRAILRHPRGARFEPLFAVSEADVVAKLKGTALSASSRDRLVHGVERFRQRQRPQYESLFGQLAHGQKPHTLLITCCDSRISPNLITSTDPGELFIVRNIGNLVPHASSPLAPAVSSAIEYSLEVLGVSDVIVCGHSACGAMKALLSPKPPEGVPGVVTWLAEGKASLQGLPPDATPEDAAKHNALVQLRHALSNDSLRRKFEAGEVKLHAWFYDVASSEVLEFNEVTRTWNPLGTQVPSERASDTNGADGVDGAGVPAQAESAPSI
ncbi:SulP family inorganic anion transporter [Melittangium boletus]|uniref:SulP family inorganic anion transporter n=1 Tax=Melittangium boletus TaxID=83453 RepID=UPI001FECF9E0|nr:bifunctional SulP family inorganic anion transporter/carbonic anhydrase [Melittangium boletus]